MHSKLLHQLHLIHHLKMTYGIIYTINTLIHDYNKICSDCIVIVLHILINYNKQKL
jgi:hypothetical protein